MCRGRPRPGAKVAFTLIESLVVTALVSVLCTIFLPSLSKSRQVAQSVFCLNNLKQISFAASLWSSDNDDWCVPASWYAPETNSPHNPNPGSLHPYIGTDSSASLILLCPAVTFANIRSWPKNNKVTYAVNQWAVNAPPNQQWPGPSLRTATSNNQWQFSNSLPDNICWNIHGALKLTTIRKPDAALYFMDHCQTMVREWNLYHPDNLNAPYPYLFRFHNQKTNLALFDASVKHQPRDFGPDLKSYNHYLLGNRCRYRHETIASK